VNRTWYYIDYRQTIDAIKWRVYKIDKDMQGVTVPANERKEYKCKLCGAEWTQMEVLDNPGARGYLCHRCGSLLEHLDETQTSGHQRSTRMNNQFMFITDLLRQIDSQVVPDNTFDHAFAARLPVQRDALHQVSESRGADTDFRPTAVKGLANTGPSTISVQISDANGPTDAEKAAERERKAALAKQNELPSWYTHSTVDGTAFKTDPSVPVGAGGIVKAEADVKTPSLVADTKAGANADFDDSFFANLKRQTEEEAARRKAAEEAEEEEDDEEDEDEFEDVVATGADNSRGATPASTAGLGASATFPAVPSPLRQSSMKREASDSPGATTAKKVKVEEPVPAPARAVAVGGGDSDEDEEIEFEDV